MDTMQERIQKAKEDPAQLNALLQDYLPFLRKQLAGFRVDCMEYDDLLTIAMVTFAGCVRQYEPERGNFLSFCSTCIHNRLIDEQRRIQRHSAALVPLSGASEHGALSEEAFSLCVYDRELERRALCEEIDAYSARLETLGIHFSELPAICPKHRRAREQCVTAAIRVVNSPDLREAFCRDGRIPQARLAREMGLSPKTIEKHRKYIVSVTVLLLGDYPGIRAFLPRGGAAGCESVEVMV